MNLRIQQVRVSEKEAAILAEIGRATFYEAFGPSNKEEDILRYTKERFSTKQILKELQHPNSQFFFAKVKNEIVGYLKINVGNAQTEKMSGKSLEIERIYVISKHQGQNIGNLLLKHSIEIAIKMKLEFIWLGVWENNTDAIRFYEKNGFKEFAQHQFILGTDIQNDVMMKYEVCNPK